MMKKTPKPAKENRKRKERETKRNEKEPKNGKAKLYLSFVDGLCIASAWLRSLAGNAFDIGAFMVVAFSVLGSA